MAFFDDTEFVASVDSKTPRCGSCGLFKKCKHPKLEVQGEGRMGILIVMPAPGPEARRTGRWLEGTDGHLLARELAAYGIDMRDDCWVTGALICPTPGDVPPKPDQVDACRPNIRKVIETLKPKQILLFGFEAIASVLKMDFKDELNNQTLVWAGEEIPSQQWNCWIYPMQAPKYLKFEGRVDDVGMYQFRDTLRSIEEVTWRPWEQVPDYPSECEQLFSAPEALEFIDQCIGPAPVAIDIETPCLKPEGLAANDRIVTIGLSNGTRTGAMPFYPTVRTKIGELLRSKTPLIGANIKFEQRWFLHEYGHGARNWLWDTMQAAHVISQRPLITSAKFQAYVRLGVSDYDGHIKPMLQADGGYGRNRIREIPRDQLLVYNGMDCLTELLVAAEQMEEFDYPHELKGMFRAKRPARPSRT